jgi:hypothetical protein
MVRKSLVAALGFIGLVAAGTAGGSTPASAGYACGHWNNWCRPVCGPWNGWCAPYYRYPGFTFRFGYSPPYWGGYRGGGHYAYRGGHRGDWNGNRHGNYDRDRHDRDYGDRDRRDRDYD